MEREKGGKEKREKRKLREKERREQRERCFFNRHWAPLRTLVIPKLPIHFNKFGVCCQMLEWCV